MDFIKTFYSSLSPGEMSYEAHLNILGKNNLENYKYKEFNFYENLWMYSN